MDIDNLMERLMNITYRCGVEDCKYNQDGECNADDVEINYISIASGFHPICDTYEEKE